MNQKMMMQHSPLYIRMPPPPPKKNMYRNALLMQIAITARYEHKTYFFPENSMNILSRVDSDELA